MSDFDPYDIDLERDSERRNILTSNQIIEDFKWLMADARGRRFMWWLLGLCGLFRSSYTGNSETYFREGMRQIGLMLTSTIQINCPERFGQMMTEHQKRERHNQR